MPWIVLHGKTIGVQIRLRIAIRKHRSSASVLSYWWPVRESNPCFQRERLASWPLDQRAIISRLVYYTTMKSKMQYLFSKKFRFIAFQNDFLFGDAFSGRRWGWRGDIRQGMRGKRTEPYQLSPSYIACFFIFIRRCRRSLTARGRRDRLRCSHPIRGLASRNPLSFLPDRGSIFQTAHGKAAIP